jgi:hypothetical protein
MKVTGSNGGETDSDSIEWPTPVCTQPECGLRRADFNRTRLAKLLAEAVFGDGEVISISEEERIVPRNTCSECALRVIRGQRPFQTADEKSQVIEEIESSQPDESFALD